MNRVAQTEARLTMTIERDVTARQTVIRVDDGYLARTRFRPGFYVTCSPSGAPDGDIIAGPYPDVAEAEAAADRMAAGALVSDSYAWVLIAAAGEPRRALRWDDR